MAIEGQTFRKRHGELVPGFDFTQEISIVPEGTAFSPTIRPVEQGDPLFGFTADNEGEQPLWTTSRLALVAIRELRESGQPVFYGVQPVAVETSHEPENVSVVFTTPSLHAVQLLGTLTILRVPIEPRK